MGFEEKKFKEMKFEEMNFEERREYFKQRIRGGEKSSINKQRMQQARKFHKAFHERMQNREEAEQEER